MSSEVRVSFRESPSGMVVGVADFERAAAKEVFLEVLGNLENAAVGVMVSGSAIEGVDLLKKVKGKKRVVDETSLRQPMVEKKFVGSGPLGGYVLKVNSKEKEEMSYNLVNCSWVDPAIARTISVYKSS
ncbi:right-handed parallel beta-helix repeat-containing protein [Sesbania bispinosa]|nr:right-handed parallel beta-helix repeat-containing protein [Sesbania bispinosa]